MRAAVILLALVAFAAPVHAQPADVPGLIKLIDNQPSDMDRSTWKEKRRDAAKKLAQSKDKRALPVLEKLAESETFDIIGEIAIEGLGTLGDPGAVPTLQKIAADNSRDKGQRDLAKKALAKLGAPETGPATPPPPPHNPPPPPPPNNNPPPPNNNPPPPNNPDTTPPPPPVNPDVGLIGSKHEPTELPDAPDLPDDTLAAYDRLTIAAGTANFNYDTLQKRLDFDGAFSGSYEKRIEREAMAWGVTANGTFQPSYIKQSAIPGAGMQASSEKSLLVVAGATGEARFYSGALYGIGKAAAAFSLTYTNTDLTDNAGNGTNFKDSNKQGDIGVALGGGYGRILDVGGAIRVRRLARTLEAARALGKPIDAATAKKLQLAWWSLRGERSGYRALVATVAILREAGILLSEPDAGLSYELMTVLRDSWLYVRPSGLDVQIAFGESYLGRANPVTQGGMMMDQYSDRLEDGRVEQLLASAGYGAQLDDDKLELSGSGYGRYRLFANNPMGTPWALGATASLKRFTYGDHGDPFGLFDLTGNVAFSDDGLDFGNNMTSQKSLHIGGQLGFTYWLNQASGLRIAGSVAEDGGALFIGGNLAITYGLLDGTFAR